MLEDAQRDEELHSVACNMQKQPGRVYHLYERSDGYRCFQRYRIQYYLLLNPRFRYFSLLSPDEWGKEEKRKEYVASYRLEPDRSWTPTSEIVKRDIQFRSLDAFLHQPSLKLEHFLT